MKIIAWIFAAAAVLRAQQPGATFELQGQVVDADSKAAVPRARVTLTLQPPLQQAAPLQQAGPLQQAAPPEQQPERAVLLTDPAGKFRVSNLTSASVLAWAERAGYISSDGSFASVASAEAKERVASVTLQLQRHAVVRGTALDESGAGLLGSVQLYRLTLNAGRYLLQHANTGTVDTEGNFRIIGLMPGRYYAEFSPFPSARTTSLHRVYRSIFYPGSSAFNEARVITLQSGDDRQVDFRPASEPAFTVSGTLNAPSEQVAFSIQSLQHLGEPFPRPSFVVEWNGNERTFSAQGLPAGEYLIKADWQNGRAFQRFNVDGAKVSGIHLEPAAAIAGLLPVAVSPESPAAPSNSIRLHSVSNVLTSDGDAAGNRYFANLSPGIYSVDTWQGYIKSAHQGGRDALRDGVIIPEDAAPDPLEVVIGPHSGKVETKLDSVLTGLPEAVQAAFLQRTALGLTIQGLFSSANHANLQPLPPGDYLVIAWSGKGTAQQLPYNEPGFVETYGNSIERVTVTESGTQTVTLHHLLPASAFEPLP